MTPTIFCETAKKQFEGVENVSMEAHDLKWAEEKKMGSFISVSRGSDEPLRFLELRYNGAANKDEGECSTRLSGVAAVLTVAPHLAAPLAFVSLVEIQLSIFTDFSASNRSARASPSTLEES